MLRAVYGLGQSDVERYNSMLNTVSELGSVADFQGFSDLCDNDDTIPNPTSFTIDLRTSSTGAALNAMRADDPGCSIGFSDYAHFADDICPAIMEESIRNNAIHQYSDCYY
jgi:hypothetical protein